MIFIAANQHIVNQLNICHEGTKTETDEKKWPTSLNTLVDDLCPQLTVRASEQHDAQGSKIIITARFNYLKVDIVNSLRIIAVRFNYLEVDIVSRIGISRVVTHQQVYIRYNSSKLAKWIPMC